MRHRLQITSPGTLWEEKLPQRAKSYLQRYFNIIKFVKRLFIAFVTLSLGPFKPYNEDSMNQTTWLKSQITFWYFPKFPPNGLRRK